MCESYKKKKVKLVVEWIPIIIGVVALIIVQCYAKKLTSGDDAWFSNVVIEQGFFDFLFNRYFEWSSRTTIEAAIYLLINHFYLWSVMNLAMNLLLICSISKLVTNKYFDKESFLLFVALYLLIPTDILYNGSWWVIGSFNYLWPIAAVMFGFVLYKNVFNEKSAGKYACFFVLLSVYGLLNEQLIIPAFLVSLGLASFFYRKYGYIFYWIIVDVSLKFIALLYIVLSPGNRARTIIEAAQWMPEFNSFGFFNKFMKGWELIAYNLYINGNIISIFCVLVMVFIANKIMTNKFLSFSLLCPLIFYISLFCVQRIGVNSDRLITILPQHEFYFLSKVLYLSGPAIFGGAIFLLWHNFRCQKLGLSLIALCSSFMAVGLVGFSPTIVASGARVLFIPTILMILFLSYILHKYKNDLCVVYNFPFLVCIVLIGVFKNIIIY